MSSRRALSIAFLLLVAYLLQTAAVAPLAWPLAGPDLYLLMVLTWMLALPRFDAVVVGFAAGLLLDLAPPIDGPVGKWALIFMVAAILLSRLRVGDESPLARTGVLGMGSAALVAGGYLFSSIIGEGEPTAPLLLTVIGVGAWNVVLAPPVLMIVRRVARGTRSVEVMR